MYRSLAAPLFILLAGLMCIACKRQPVHPQLSFYHWTNKGPDYSHETEEQNCLTRFGTKELYVKIMDVDWDDIYGVYPSTSFYFHNLSYLPDSVQLVPVVFITNKALEKTDSGTAIHELAKKIVLKTEQLVRQEYSWNHGEIFYYKDSLFRCSELQLDCDWTATTRAKYFSLLTDIKQSFPDMHTTSTLRLHQYRHPEKTGVPPVDEVYLMCYNTGDVKNLEEQNSIYDSARAKPYFEGAKRYPLKMNFALPAFDWIVIFKNGGFYKIDNQMDVHLLQDSLFAKPLSRNQYEVRKDTVINNAFIRYGDILKWETITERDMTDAARNCTTAVNSDSFKVIFYDISHISSDKYETIQKAFDCFRN